jgi:phosphatidate cytidylyltransferase
MPGGNAASVHVLADPAARWSDLGKRAASAAILGPVALGCIWFGGAAYKAMIVVAAAGMAMEWVHMCGQRAVHPTGLAIIAAAAAAAICAALGFPLAGLALMALATAVALLLSRRVALPMGLPYVGIGTVAMTWLRADPSVGRANLLFLLLVIWASDIGAYVAGRMIGGPRLAPRISPGKTWSGAAGGLVVAVVVGMLSAFLLQPPASLVRTACLAAGLGIIAQLGDLLESRIKRHFGVKDSGHLIPGHGGLLDRLDAVLTTAPIAAVLALVAGPGVVLWQ